jgi:signal transduction histidine kinase
LHLPVFNASANSQTRYLLLETNWMESMRVWLSVGEDDRLILDQDQHMPFRTRKIPHQNLVTKFTLEPGQAATLWLRYSSRGSTALPINIETEFSFLQRSQVRASKSMIFFSLMLLFITVAGLSYFLFRYAIFPIYVCYATTVLLYVMHRDGFAFQYLWPSWPDWNAFASLPLGAGLGLFAILFSRQYLSTSKRYPKTDRLLLLCMFLLAGLVPYGMLVDEQGAKQIASLWVFLVAVMLLALGIRSWMDMGRRMIFFVAGWLGVVVASLAMLLGGFLGAEISRETTLDAIRLAMVFDALMLGFAMAERVLQIRKERDVALSRQLEALQDNLDMHERLSRLEARYSDALESARSSGKVLADATHDIRQPLFALRMSLRSIGAEKNSEQFASAARNLVYLEQLVEEYLEKATSDTSANSRQRAAESSIPVQVVLTAIADMFLDDMQARGKRFRVRPSRTVMNANAMVVTRIVSNFVANALQYSGKGGVLVGVRRRAGKEYIAVYDSGPGMDRETLERVVRRAERGDIDDAAQGKGLGLDIALSLGRQHGLATIAESVPGKGSLFAVAIRADKI